MTPYTLITGASKGLGLALAHECAAHGQHLILTARTFDLLEKIKFEFEKRYNISVEVISVDLTKQGAVAEIKRFCDDNNYVVNALINNAGFGNTGEFAETEMARDLDMVHVNISVLTEMTKLFLKDMKTRKDGRIMNVASTAAFQPGPYGSVYYASKAYVYSFSCALHEELKGTGVSVTALCPGPTDTDFFKEAKMEALKLKRTHMMSAEAVAKAGFKAMMKGKRECVPGFKNRFLIFAGKLAPMGITLKAVKWMMKE